MVEIWIGTEKADYDGDIETQYSVTDFRELGSGNLNTSYDIELPNTETNQRLLKYISTLSVTDEQNALSRIYVNGTEIIRGNLIVMGANELYTTIIIKSDDWFDGFKDISIKDLNLSTYDLTYNTTNVVASWTALAGEFMRFPLVYFGKLDFGSTEFQASDFVPWFNIYKIIEKIFAGYTITSTFLADTYFQSLYCSVQEPVKDSSFLEQMGMDVSTVDADNQIIVSYNPGDNKSTVLTCDPVIFDTLTELGHYDGSTDVYTIPETGTYRFKFTYDIQSSYSGMTLNSASYSVKIIRDPLSGSNVDLVTATGSTADASGVLDTGYIHLVLGDKIYCYARQSLSILNSGGTPRDAQIDLLSSKFEALDDVRCLHPGLGITIEPELWLQDIKQSEFIEGVKKMFNLVIWLDSWSKTIYIEPSPTFFTANIKDISSKIDYTEINQDLISQNYTSKINLIYKNDESDESVKWYNANNTVQLGQKSITLTSLFAPNGTTTIENLFSTFVKDTVYTTAQITPDSVPRILRQWDPTVGTYPTERLSDFNIKIGEWKGYSASADHWHYEGGSYPNYPQIDAIDLATIYPTYFAKTFHLIDKGKIVTLEGVADPLDILEFNTVISTAANEGFRCLYKFLYQNEYHYGILNKYSTNGIKFKAELTLII